MSNANKSAYPHKGYPLPQGGAPVPGSRGLTKREYFAGLMLQALIANPERYKYISGLMDTSGKKPVVGEGRAITQDEATAKNVHKAIMLTDALLLALEKAP